MLRGLLSRLLPMLLRLLRVLLLRLLSWLLKMKIIVHM